MNLSQNMIISPRYCILWLKFPSPLYFSKIRDKLHYFEIQRETFTHFCSIFRRQSGFFLIFFTPKNPGVDPGGKFWNPEPRGWKNDPKMETLVISQKVNMFCWSMTWIFHVEKCDIYRWNED